MKKIKFLFASCLFVISFCAAANAQNLKIGMVPTPCSVYGATAQLPLTLTNGPGVSIAGVSADITFDNTYFEFDTAVIGAAGAAASKDITSILLTPNTVRVGVLSTSNFNVIGDGVVANVNFKLIKNPVGGKNITISAGASDPAGLPVTITSTNGGLYTVKTGDIDMDGTVTIAEVLSTISMFLGATAVDPICDVEGNGIVEISDVVKVINCALETSTCACDANATTTTEETKWQGSGHADTSAMAFNDWNECTPVLPATSCTPAVPSTCSKCHTTTGYVNYVNGLTAVSVPPGEVISCTACHDAAAEAMTSVVFESSGSTAAPVVANVTVSGLGAEARCIVCHQGRGSQAMQDANIAARPANVPVVQLDTPDSGLKLTSMHEFYAAAVQFGGEAKIGYQYTGKIYDAKFAHVDGYDTCITCHDQHSLEVKYDACVTCHTGAIDAAGLKYIRMKGSLEDYDGDGNTTEGISSEVQGVAAKLLVAIQQYAHEVSLVDTGVYTANENKFYIDTNGDGVIDPATETTSYNAYTPRMVKAVFNYRFALNDPGSYAHGGKYVIELMYDSIEDLNAGLTAVVPAVVKAVDVTTLTRNDEGHFNGGSEVFRHWDSTGVIPGGTTGCVKCHAGEGIPFFLTNGINIADVPANGMMCVNCHSSVTDGVPPHTAPRRVVNSVTFPSGLVAGFGAADDSNLCLLCHQARESTVSLNAKIAAAPGSTTLSFTNSHYFAAGATLFGTQAKSAYEYALPVRTYAGQNPFNSHGGQFNKCVQCHMGSDSPTGNSSHNVASVININCICHYGDVSQTPGDFQFDNIRPIIGVTTTDFDGDGVVTESLKSEMDGLAAQLLSAIQAYASATVGAAFAMKPYTTLFRC